MQIGLAELMPNYRNTTTTPSSADISLQLLGSFSVSVAGEPVAIPGPAKSLLAIVALCGGRAPRSRVVGTIWPEKGEKRALANLRSVRSRLPAGLRSSIENLGTTISLSRRWTVDFDDAMATAEELHRSGGAANVRREVLCGDLLPDWDEHWLVVRREQHRQLRLHALESLARAELAAGQCLDAVDTVLSAVASEPLRESAQLLLLEAHLAAGNRAAAFRQFERFERLLHDELGVPPSPRLQAMVAAAGWEPH